MPMVGAGHQSSRLRRQWQALDTGPTVTPCPGTPVLPYSVLSPSNGLDATAPDDRTSRDVITVRTASKVVSAITVC